ncbi:MAG: hypothetical protein IPH80_33365 [Myxococcales bacterium]|nr:hypothetical protein [Myxococcales bacterium]
MNTTTAIMTRSTTSPSLGCSEAPIGTAELRAALGDAHALLRWLRDRWAVNDAAMAADPDMLSALLDAGDALARAAAPAHARHDERTAAVAGLAAHAPAVAARLAELRSALPHGQSADDAVAVATLAVAYALDVVAVDGAAIEGAGLFFVATAAKNGGGQ